MHNHAQSNGAVTVKSNTIVGVWRVRMIVVNHGHGARLTQPVRRIKTECNHALTVNSFPSHLSTRESRGCRAVARCGPVSRVRQGIVNLAGVPVDFQTAQMSDAADIPGWVFVGSRKAMSPTMPRWLML